MVSLTEAAVADRRRGAGRAGVLLLEPYAGRAVVNGGGVAFTGVVDDYLARACGARSRGGRPAVGRAGRARRTERMGATWWSRRLAALGRPARPTGRGAPAPRRRRHLVGRPRRGGHHPARHEGAALPAPGPRSGPASTSRPWTCPTRSPATPEPGWSRGAPVRCSTGRRWQSYRRRLTEIDEDLDEARTWSDAGARRAAGGGAGRAAGPARTATGLAGRRRGSAATSERARVAVRKAIATAIDRIAAVDPALGTAAP